jgi:hypothetical protein
VAALLVEGLAFAVLLGVTGSPGWRAARAPAIRAIAALAFGLAELMAGAGTGVMHLVESDLTVTAVAAIVALAAWLVLVGVGVGRLWKLTPGWWRLLGVPVAYLLVGFLLVPVTVAIYGTNVPATHLASVTPADRGLAYQDVSLISSHGVRLSAWYIPSRNGAAIVALHGSGSTRTPALDQAAVVARHGYGVMLLDARGHGRSDGTAMDFDWWGDRDIGAATRWLQSCPDVREGRIGALGMSIGGEEAIGAAATNKKAIPPSSPRVRSRAARWIPIGCPPICPAISNGACSASRPR